MLVENLAEINKDLNEKLEIVQHPLFPYASYIYIIFLILIIRALLDYFGVHRNRQKLEEEWAQGIENRLKYRGNLPRCIFIVTICALGIFCVFTYWYYLALTLLILIVIFKWITGRITKP